MIDRTVLKRLFCQHYSEMKHLAWTLLYDDDEAEDTVQDVFLRLIQRDNLPEENKTRAYLMAAVRNGCVNRIRQKSVTEQAKRIYSVETESDLLYNEERFEVMDAVCDYADNHLAEPHHTIFHLRFKEGLTLKEIARKMDMNLKTVFKYLSQSIQDVKKHYGH